MISVFQIARFLKIEHVLVKYALEELVLEHSRYRWLAALTYLSPSRWRHRANRAKPRGERIRLALEELGPIFVKLGQILSTRRDLLPEDIGLELTKLQDKVPPFPNTIAISEIELALGKNLDLVFKNFEKEPLAAASIAQVYAATLRDGQEVIVKVLRPGIEKVIDRDVSLMYLIASIMETVWGDARRFRPREVVAEYDNTIHNELDFMREASNATRIKNNFLDSKLLYIPPVHWEWTRQNVLVMERIYGISIRDVPAMHAIDMDMKRLAVNAVDIFYTQVFKHNFFHADMHPGNIFVSPDFPENPRFIAVDFGIVGSLTEEDQHYLGENLLAFFQRDYRRVAQLHVDSGWVPVNTSVADFEEAVRCVCDPIFEKPLSEISFGVVLVQLFQTARRFNMEVQPQLVLLQKTLLNIEGLGRQLYPQLDLWETAKPFLENWVRERRGPKALATKLVSQMPYVLDKLPELPRLMDNLLAQGGLQHAILEQQKVDQLKQAKQNKALIMTISGSTLILVATVIGAAHYILSGGEQNVPVYIWLLGGLASVLFIRGMVS